MREQRWVLSKVTRLSAVSLNHRQLKPMITKFLSISIVGVLVSSVIPLGYGDVWYAQYLGLLFILYCLPILFLWKFNRWISAFLMVSLLSSFFQTRLSPRSIILLTQLEALSLVSYGISILTSKSRQTLRNTFILVFLLQIGLLILQFFQVDPFFVSLHKFPKNNLVGFMGAKDQLGSFFALLSPIVVSWHSITLIPLYIGLCITKSSFAFVSSLLALALFFFYRSKKKLIFFLIPLVLFFTQMDKLRKVDFSTRTSVWKYAVSSVMKGRIETSRGNFTCSPVSGYGMGSFTSVFPYVVDTTGHFNYSNEKFTHAHNDYIETFFDLGFAGILILIGLLISTLISFLRSGKNLEIVTYFSCLVAYALNMTGNFISHMAVSGFYLSVLYGMYRGSLNGQNTVQS